MDKILRLSDFGKTIDPEQFAGVTACFGHFNAIHPGHVRYFRTARDHGRPLVVALEGDAQLPTPLRGNVFPEGERAQPLAALDLVDYVVILDNAPLEDFVRQVNISALALGREFEENRAAEVASAVAAARARGAEVIYDAGETHYASADLLFDSIGDLERHRWQTFRQTLKVQDISLPDVLSAMSEGRKPHIMIIGDSIVDRYVACDPVGMSNEAPVVVVKEMETRDYVGGAGIVAAHVAALGAKSTFLSVVGNDGWASFTEERLREFGVEPLLFKDDSRPTTFKIRYLVDNQKLFRVSRLKEHGLPRQIEDQVVAKLNEQASTLDGILVSDFVYGSITPRVVEALRTVSDEHNIPLFGDLQCSSQVGSILKFKDFSLICPTEREARIALANHSDGLERIANLLIEKTRSASTILKLGGDGFIAYQGQQEQDLLRRQHFPALTANPVDVAGAGDALLAAMATSLTRGLSLMQASALACCVSAIAVQTVGNRPISLSQVRRFYSQHFNNGLIDAV